jgi:hypothetical protein
MGGRKSAIFSLRKAQKKAKQTLAVKKKQNKDKFS